MNSINLATDLFGKKEVISLLDGKTVVGKTGPAGFGISALRPASVKSSVKFNGAAWVLSYFLKEHTFNVISSPTTPQAIYIELTYNGKAHHAMVEETDDGGSSSLTVSWGDTCPTEAYASLIPIVAYALSEACSTKETEELKEIFQRVVNDYNAKGSVELKDVLQFCDSFYYGFAVNNENVGFYEDDCSMELFRSTYESKRMDFDPIFDNVEGKIALKALEGLTLRPTKKDKKTKAKATSTIFEDCMNGSHAIPYEWSEDQALKIPDINSLNDFIATPHFYSLLNKIETRTEKILERMDNDKTGVEAIGRDYVNSFIIGKPGTGKTTMAYALGAALRMPVYTVAITKNTEEDTFQGMTKVVDGGFKFVSTDFLDAYTHGGIIILEEVNLADPSVIMGALGQAVEAPFILMKDGYQAVRRHPMCIIIGTMNIGTYGAKGVSQAFSSRFKQTYILDDPKAEDFISILEKQGHSTKKCKWVYDAYTKINNYLKSPEISREEICLNVTLRGCLGALDNMEEGDTPQQAIYNTLVGKVAEVDLELAEDINKNIVRSLPNLSI